MPKPNRWVLLGSGSLAAMIAAGACAALLLHWGPETAHKQAEVLATYAMEAPPAPAVIAPPLPAVQAEGVGEGIPATAAIAVNVPQLAYSYTLGYRLPAGDRKSVV